MKFEDNLYSRISGNQELNNALKIIERHFFDLYNRGRDVSIPDKSKSVDDFLNLVWSSARCLEIEAIDHLIECFKKIKHENETIYRNSDLKMCERDEDINILNMFKDCINYSKTIDNKEIK